MLERWIDWQTSNAEYRGVKFNQVILADKSGIAQQYISALLTGKRRLGDKVLTRICAAMEITKAEFFDGPPPRRLRAAGSVTIDGSQVQRLRERMGMPVGWLAKQAGISVKHCMSIESQLDYVALPDLAQKIAAALKVRPDEIEVQVPDAIKNFVTHQIMDCALCGKPNIDNDTGVCVHCKQPLRAAKKITTFLPDGSPQPQAASSAEPEVERTFTIPDSFDGDDILRMKGVKLLCHLKGDDLGRVVAYMEGIFDTKRSQKNFTDA